LYVVRGDPLRFSGGAHFSLKTPATLRSFFSLLRGRLDVRGDAVPSAARLVFNHSPFAVLRLGKTGPNVLTEFSECHLSNAHHLSPFEKGMKRGPASLVILSDSPATHHRRGRETKLSRSCSRPTCSPRNRAMISATP